MSQDTTAAPDTGRARTVRSSGGLTPAATRTCQVWWARPAQFPAEVLDMLSAGEHERRETTHRSDDRDRFTTGAVVLRLALSSLLGIPPGSIPIDRTCPECQAPHGRPRVPGILGADCSVTHSEDQVGVAVARGRRIGIDIEALVEQDELNDLAADVLTPRERASLARRPHDRRPYAFARLWTAKEAVLKATGDGLRICPCAVEVCATRTDLRFTRLPQIPALAHGAVLRRLTHPSGVASLAALGDEPLTVREGPVAALYAQSPGVDP